MRDLERSSSSRKMALDQITVIEIGLNATMKKIQKTYACLKIAYFCERPLPDQAMPGEYQQEHPPDPQLFCVAD